MAPRCFSAIAIPTAIANPCPSGPVVASTPSVSPYSGCPGVRECHCRKLFRSSMRDLVSGKKKRAIQQRRGVPVRKHKAVAVGPLRMRRIVLHDFVKQQDRQSGRSPAARRDGRYWPSPPHRRRASAMYRSTIRPDERSARVAIKLGSHSFRKNAAGEFTPRSEARC